jgi:hypothetical protein
MLTAKPARSPGSANDLGDAKQAGSTLAPSAWAFSGSIT